MNELLNQRGFLEAPAFVLLVLLSSWLMLQTLTWRARLQAIKEHHQQVLCLKRAIITTDQMVKQINGINHMLFTGRVGQGLALLFPGTGWLLALKWEKAKKVLMTLQEVAWLKAQHQLVLSRQRGCRLPPWVHLTPYQHRAGLVRRDDLTELRKTSESWPLITPLMTFHSRWSLSSALNPRLQWEVR